MSIALDILRQTNDGDELSPAELYLVQEYVNRNLTEQGRIEVERILTDIEDGTFVPYSKRWFHGQENLTANHESYVFWKGIQVEHFSFVGKDAYIREKKEAEDLAARCREMEAYGLNPGWNNALFWADIKMVATKMAREMVRDGTIQVE